MTEVLLLVVVALLWAIVRRKRDWYVVEWRFCSDKKLASDFMGAPRHVVDKLSMDAYKLTKIQHRLNGVRLRGESGGELQIEQMVFERPDAACLHFEHLKRIIGHTEGMPFHKLYMFKVTASSRGQALCLPPTTNMHKLDEQMLLAYPDQFFMGSGIEKPRPATRAE